MARGSRRALVDLDRTAFGEGALRGGRENQSFNGPLRVEKPGIGPAIDAIHEALQFGLIGITARHRNRLRRGFAADDREGASGRAILEDGEMREGRAFEQRSKAHSEGRSQ